MSGNLVKDKIKKRNDNFKLYLKHLYGTAENCFSIFAEVEKLKNKQMLFEEILSEEKTGDALKGKFISGELNNLLLDLKARLDRLIRNYGSQFLTFDSFKLEKVIR